MVITFLNYVWNTNNNNKNSKRERERERVSIVEQSTCTLRHFISVHCFTGYRLEKAEV